jgi:hypothetical protein
MPRTSYLARPLVARARAATAAVALAITSTGGASTAVALENGHLADRAASTTAAAPGASRAAKSTARAVELDVRQAAPPTGYTTFVNSGAAVLHISVVSDAGGSLVDGTPRVAQAGDRAVRYPRHSDEVTAPHAVIQIVDRRGADDLDPGSGPFRFGADFILDAVSEDTQPGGRDNGDNLVQRGRFNQASQYKVQLDHRVATCRVKGSLGAVSVSSSIRPVPGTWYRVRCIREADELTIVMTSWQYGVPSTVRASASGPIGVVSPASRTIPVSVGGKLARRGVIDTASDQFNGRIDNVFIRVG